MEVGAKDKVHARFPAASAMHIEGTFPVFVAGKAALTVMNSV
jgi:hypothetical protein